MELIGVANLFQEVALFIGLMLQYPAKDSEVLDI